MIFMCDNCGFIFSRTSETDQCPDCGQRMARPANEMEQHEFTHRMVELIQTKQAEAPRFPNVVDTEIFMLNSFSFRLPATALQINSNMIVDLLVEYGENSADRSELVGNIWVRQKDALTVHFLMSVHLPVKREESQKEQVNRVFAALNENQTFKTKLFDFVSKQLDGGE